MWAISYDVSCKEKDIMPMLNLPIWNFALSGFNSELDWVIFYGSRLDTNHSLVNWNQNPFHKFILSIIV